ncbi:enoyl-CoA hydratase/isomerase family protein [Rhodovulum sp. DZ06]|uniref:enoyl-CoA hydratase/isomerase family protein n=1 Tax=Rhodovulum sp. DZ06 TaxID=3425126 RepID=UPI003D32AB10
MTDDAPQALRITREGGIALLEMTNPKKRNPLNQALKDALAAAARELTDDASLRAVIIAGSDGVFCAGGDLKAMNAEREAGTYDGAEDYLGRLRHMHGWVRALRGLPVPVIAAVDGPAYGAGLGIALVADFIIATDRAAFNASFCRVGLVPDGGLFYSLPRAVGAQRAKEMFYTGRTVTAEEAQRIGLVMEVVAPEDLMDRAWASARMMTEGNPAAFELTKRISGQALETDAETLLALEQQAQSICLSSRYNGEAVERFTNKKPLRFDYR